MKTNLVIYNLLFYFLGIIHFDTFNIFEFWEVKSIINGYPDADTAFLFLLACQFVIILLSYGTKKYVEYEKRLNSNKERHRNDFDSFIW
jgi:hypothetical protein